MDAYRRKNSKKASVETPPAIRVSLVPRPTADEANLNKTERRWLEELRRLGYPALEIQAITFKLGDDCRYTPDFSAIGPNGELRCWEVKGFMREDALVKLKVAARKFPWVTFVLVRKEGCAFVETEIKP